jgi:subfamily B ATP-binding cassette protein MsbA
VAAALTALLPVVMAPILDLALGSGRPAPAPSTGILRGFDLQTLGAAVLQAVGFDASSDRFKPIVLFCVAYVVIGLLKSGADFSTYLLGLWIRARASAAMQAHLFGHLLSLSLSFFTKQRVGDLVSRLDTDTRSATYPLEVIIITGLTAPVLIVIYGVLLVRTSYELVLAALAAGCVHYGVTRIVKGPVRRLAAQQFTAFADLISRFQEVLANIREVKALCAERLELQRLKGSLKDVIRLQVRFGFYKHIDEPARSAANYLVESTIILMAAWQLLAGQISVPTFFLFMYVGRLVMVQVGRLGTAWTEVQSVLAASSRVVQLLSERPRVPDGAETIGAFRDRLRLEDVSFGYAEDLVLEGIDLEIARGDIVAVVGPSGIGKSTLADLILRFHDPTTGRITIDGHDIRRFRQDAYRGLFGVVSQDPVLFNTTIRANIAYGRDGLGDEDIVRAAMAANAHTFITELPEGYDTIVGERGLRLSGGQRQRVAIARAIVSHPQILVLDEATSSLDTQSEKLVQEAIDHAIAGSTSVIIAHRLSTVLHADRIVVLSGRRIEAVGSHRELLESSPTYARLCQFQFATTAQAPLRADPA